MAMKKDELEHHQRQYQALMADAQAAEQAGLYRAVVEKALESWEHIDGMMQYERRYNKKEFTGVPAIELTLKYAPLLLDFASLDRLEGLLKDCRRIEKNTSHNLATKLAAARELMWDAHSLWDHLERNPGSRQDELRTLLGGRQKRWCGIAETWEKMGLLQRKPEDETCRLTLSTRLGEIVPVKCPACGNVTEAPKAMCLEETPCPECQKRVLFVIISSRSVTDAKE